MKQHLVDRLLQVSNRLHSVLIASRRAVPPEADHMAVCISCATGRTSGVAHEPLSLALDFAGVVRLLAKVTEGCSDAGS
jgi:hypothetical protein